MTSVKFFSAFLLLFSLLAGCGDDQKPREQVSVTASAPGVYESTLAEGIDFRRPGYPSFLGEVTGMCSHEKWGRWTEGPLAKFRFKQPLPAKFTLVLTAGAIGPNLGKAIVVRVGNLQREFTATDPGVKVFPGTKEFELVFENVSGDTLEIMVPQPVRPRDINPNSTDDRMLGVALVTLQIK